MHSSPGRPSRARGEPSAWTGTERGSRFIVRCSLTKDSRTYRCDGHGCGLNGTCVPSGPPSRVVPAHPSLSLLAPPVHGPSPFGSIGGRHACDGVRWGQGGAVAPPLCFDTRRRGVLAKTCASSTRSAAGLGAGASARGGSAASARELLIRGRSLCCRVVCFADRCATGARCRHCKHPRFMVPRMMLFIVAVGSQVKLVQPSIPTVTGYILTLL